MGYPDTPYNYPGMLEELLSNSETQIDGLTAQRQNLMGQYDDITQSSPAEGAGAYGSIVLPFLAGYLGGRGGGDGVATGMAAAGKAGETYYNNLDADEKARKALNLGEQQRVEKERTDQINFNQQLTGYGLSSTAQKEQSYLTGQQVGTAPYNQRQADAEEIAGIRRTKPGDDTMLSPAEVNPSLQKMGLPPVTEPIRADKYKIMLSGERVAAAAISANTGVQSLEQRGQKLGMALAESVVPGYIQIGEAKLKPEQAAKLKERNAGLISTLSNLDALQESVAKTGTLDVLGTEPYVQNAIQAILTNQGRLRTGSGANFTETEMKLINALSVPTARSDPWGAIKNAMAGVDPSEALTSIKTLLQKSQDIEYLGYGLVAPQRDYDMKVLDSLNLGKAYQEARNGGFKSPTAESFSTSGTTAPATTTTTKKRPTFEEWKAMQGTK